MNTELADSLTPSRQRQVFALIGWGALCLAAAVLGGTVSIDEWYTSLQKPDWNPPAWIFGPVWTVLYLMMSVAAWLVWREGGWRTRSWPLGLFLGQLLLNAIWTPVFFGMYRIGLALIDIALLWMLLGITLIAFWRVNRPAGWLLVPYLAWVSFATVLNFTLWRMNS